MAIITELNKPKIDQGQKGESTVIAPFKILSIDGGGMKGLYAAQMLAQFERKTGQLIGEYFDLLTGTSTGGLISLAITCGVPCEEVARFYREHGPKIFPSGGSIKSRFSKLRQFAWSTKYDKAPLIQAIKVMLDDHRTMKDANHLMCIPAYNLTKGRPTVFKKPFGNYHRDGRFKMLDVALATSAAPTFLPAVRIEGDQYIDGGIYANNPSLIGYTEAVDHFLGREIEIGDSTIEYETVELLSIGLPSEPLGMQFNVNSKKSFMGWREKLIHSAMNGSDFISHYQTEKLIHSRGGQYFRLNPPQLSPAQLKNIQMDNSTVDAIQLLMTYGQDVGDDITGSRWHEIKHFFSNYKTLKF